MTELVAPPFGAPVADTPASDQLTVRELLEQPLMAESSLIAGGSGLDLPIRRLNVMTVPEIVNWVGKGEFLLSTGFPLRAHGDSLRLVRDLSEIGLSGLGVKLDSYLDTLEPEVLELADELGFPIVTISFDTRFDDILSQAFETIVNRQAAELNRSHRLHHTFLDLTFSGGGLQSLMDELARELDASAAAVVDRHGTVMAYAGEPGLLTSLNLDPAALEVGRHCAGELSWVVAAMSAAGVVHGHVLVVGPESVLARYAVAAAEQAAIVCTLEMIRGQAVRAVTGRFASNLLHELMTGDDLEGVSARAAALDWVLNREIVVVTARPEDGRPVAGPTVEQSQVLEQLTSERWAAACRKIDPHAAVGVLGARLVAVLGGQPRLVNEQIGGLHTEMSRSTRREFALGVSRWHPGPVGIRLAYQEALDAMRLGTRVNGTHAVTHYDRLGLFRLLAQIDPAELDVFVSDTLGPVLELPEPERSDLLNTLDLLLANHLKIAQTAREVHYHYNTLRYRLIKLEKMLGEFSTDPATARCLGVAIEILRMHGGSALRPSPHD